jgi:hypothetical protein
VNGREKVLMVGWHHFQFGMPENKGFGSGFGKFESWLAFSIWHANEFGSGFQFRRDFVLFFARFNAYHSSLLTVIQTYRNYR